MEYTSIRPRKKDSIGQGLYHVVTCKHIDNDNDFMKGTLRKKDENGKVGKKMKGK